MPAKDVMKKFRKGTLRSGSKHGPVVKNPRQAKAIELSELRDEGHNIPTKSASYKARNRRLEKVKI